jgi:Flp pilus assembly protein TadG
MKKEQNNKSRSGNNFWTSQGGTVAVIFALAMIPLFLVAGVALDYSKATRFQTKLQAAVDSAALAVAFDEKMSESELQELGKHYIETNLGIKGSASVRPPSIQITATHVIVDQAIDIPTSFLRLVGINKIEVAADAEVPRFKRGRAELVLVLDYSGSMNTNDKYIRMRDAALELIDFLSDNGSNDEVSFGLVPFSSMVYTDLPNEHVLGQSSSGTWTGCTGDRQHPFNQESSTPNPNAEDEKWTPTDEYVVNSSSTDPCSNYVSRNLKVKPLTNDFDAVKQQLNAMVPNRMTHIALGIEFGWHVISHEAPFNEGKPYGDAQNTKAVIVLTDGKQTARANGPSGGSSPENAADNIAALCDGMKAEDIQVYTIGYDLDDPETLDLLKSCADEGRFFQPSESGNEISAVFNSIGNQVNETMLRLSK